MGIENANTHPVKVALVDKADMYANSHPYQVAVVGGGGGTGQIARIVDELPEVGETGYIYLVLKEKTEEGNIYDEFLWALQPDGKTYSWEPIGTSSEVTVKLYDGIGENTDGAMTQKAVTDTIFADGATAKKVQIGDGATASGNLSTAIGQGSNATGERAISIGDKFATTEDAASGNSTVSIGTNTRATATGGVAISTRAAALGEAAVAVGTYAEAEGQYSVATGFYSKAGRRGISSGYQAESGNQGVAIGSQAKSTGVSSVALGMGAQAGSDQSVAVRGNASGANSVAIGYGSEATEKGQFDISTGAYLVGYNNSKYRKITGVYPGENDNDAATVAQVNEVTVPTFTNAEFNEIFGTDLEEES